MKLLFVCLGNICRSPMAETVFRKRVAELGLKNEISIDSAGTAGYHEGELADARMRKHAEKRGYSIASRSRKVRMEDFENFDKIIAMDNSNVRDLQLNCPKEYWQKIVKMTDYATRHTLTEVPDPYYGGEAGFELVIDLLEDASEGLLKEILIENK